MIVLQVQLLDLCIDIRRRMTEVNDLGIDSLLGQEVSSIHIVSAYLVVRNRETTSFAFNLALQIGTTEFLTKDMGR